MVRAAQWSCTVPYDQKSGSHIHAIHVIHVIHVTFMLFMLFKNWLNVIQKYIHVIHVIHVIQKLTKICLGELKYNRVWNWLKYICVNLI